MKMLEDSNSISPNDIELSTLGIIYFLLIASLFKGEMIGALDVIVLSFEERFLLVRLKICDNIF